MKQEMRWRGLGAVVVLVWALLGGINVAMAYPIPDSGQTNCYSNTTEIPCPQPGEAFYGQDGNYPGNPRSYTKLDASGNELPDTATSWAMVRDNVTRLEWEGKTTDGTIHDTSKFFTWCDNNPATNGGYAGTCGNGADTEAFIANLNTANFGGHHDWRLPTERELYSLPNRGTYLPAIDVAYFPNTQSSSYWSATTLAGNTDYYAWRVDFNDGYDDYGSHKSDSYFVRAVRSGQGIDHLTDNGDGTVTATATGLMWQQATAPPATWQVALAYTEGLGLAGYSDWRLPTIEELKTLVDYSKLYSSPTIDQAAFPNTHSASYWSATTSADYTYYAWHVYFDNGNGNYKVKSNACYVRAVRSGQGIGPFVIAEPQPGATVVVGDTVAMAWDPKDIGGQVAISLSRDGGKAWEVISPNTANDGAFAWQVSGPLSVNCLLKVEPLADPEQASYQGLFSIATTVAPTTTTTTAVSTSTSTTEASTTTTIPGNVSASLPVSAGWSLLSSTTGFDAALIFGDSAIFTSVWKWADGGTGDKTWAVYLPGDDGGVAYAASKGFLALTTISSGEGFWVNSKADQSVQISGAPVYGPLTFSPGWNLVGVKGLQQAAVSELGAVTSVWKWTTVGTAKTWAVNLPGETDAGAAYALAKGFGQFSTIAPGEGFWVNNQ